LELGKVVFILLTCLVLLPLVNAASPFTQTSDATLNIESPYLPILKQGQDHRFHAHVVNATRLKTNTTTQCTLHLYNQSGYSALEDFKQRDMRIAGWTEERRRLGIADHCSGEGATPGCIELAGASWRPIGTLPKIGEALCKTNCKCSFQYRRPKQGGGWIVEDAG